MKTFPRWGGRTAAVTLVAAIGWAAAPPAYAAGATYGTWTLAGAGTSWTGTLAMGATGFPVASFASNSNTPQVPSGASTFLGPATPFGAVFGSSANQGYLNLRTSGNTPSVTTFTFATPTPADTWGFTLGDIDADQVTIAATDAAGNPVGAAALGFQSVFNYCASSPRPSSCATGPFTDTPTWNPVTAALTGSGLDTTGGAGWFRPTVPLASIRFTFAALSGSPIYQIWAAAFPTVIGGPNPVGSLPTTGVPVLSLLAVAGLLTAAGVGIRVAARRP